ncbi:putative phage abortive infection protein [Variovorax sp. DAIF25]|uniref:putative phage abortive infection protein n=1 Tax=Variovorax sp. DAIF25 TaxID=3080983 RepID=UPI003D6C0E02
MANDESPIHRGWYFVPFLVVLSAWGICWWALGDDTANRGSFGDMFGAVNALFSGFAFAGLILAIRLQSEELALQRRELADTRTVLQDQQKQMQAQAETLELQQFEATFFQLLRAHGDIVNAIDIVNMKSQHVTRGRDCIKTFYERLEGSIYGSVRRDLLGRARSGYGAFYQEHEHELGHYFRHLYHIIKFVDLSNVAEKRRYTSFVRAQISSFECLMLFYNCLSEQGEENFKPLAEKYALFKHLPKGRVDPELYKVFKPSAYLPHSPGPADLAAIKAAAPDRWIDA